jgi:hypothetical protein
MEEMSDEEFRVCPIIKSLQVSQYGRVKNRHTGEILNPILSEEKYLVVENPENEGKPEFVHRLVAFSWKNANPPEGAVVHHINGNSCDNRATNLFWVDREVHDLIHGRGSFTKVDENGVATNPYDDVSFVEVSGVLVKKEKAGNAKVADTK